MRAVMLSWEFPPRIVGGLARHIEGLSAELADRGHEVHVITLDFPGSPSLEQNGSLYIHRVPVELPAPTFHTWVLLFNHFFEKKVGQIAHEYGVPDLVHAHDWLTVPAGVASKHLLRRPYVMTFHSTEAVRSAGSTSMESNLVRGLEWWGSFEASRIITVSRWMKDHVTELFKLPSEKVDVIPNGVDFSKFQGEPDMPVNRVKWVSNPHDFLVTAVGRMTSQKGFDTLLRAFPQILRSVPTARLLMIGDGYMKSELEGLAREEGVADSVMFSGFINDEQLVGALKSSSVVVVPSRFEPFGIIALEAMAAGVPIVVSNVGGLAEIVEDNVDGLEVEPENPQAIADAVVRVLSEPTLAQGLVTHSREKVKRYGWGRAAEATQLAYRRAIGETKYE